MMIYFLLFLSLAISIAILYFIIPMIIQVSIKKKLFDVSNRRSATKQVVPLGGIEVYNEGRITPEKTSSSSILASTINDITERKIAIEALKESELRYRLLTESAPVGIFTTDAFGTTNYVNPRWCEISQISFDEAMGDGWLKAVHPEDKDNLAFGWQHATHANNSSVADYRFIHPDGSIAWVIGQAVPLKNEEGNNIGYIGTITDITERKKMEEELIVLTAKAEESDQLKTAFLNNMSHEIRTPLNGILGFSKLLVDQDLTQENKNKFIRIIEKCGDQLHNIISNIIDISKIELGQTKISTSEINIEEQIEFIYKFFIEEVKQKGLQMLVSNSLNSSNGLIRTDREKLIVILANLVKNAVKYTEEGSIEIGYSLNQIDKKNVNGVRFPCEFEFFVKDTGVGIRKDRQGAIFERFIKADIIDKKARQGMGLGLAISKAYVAMLGGKIWVDSEEGKGSIFYFTIPYDNEPKEEKPSMMKFSPLSKNAKSAI